MEKADQPRLTPMYEQYLKVKAEYPDALLFYRMGDFTRCFRGCRGGVPRAAAHPDQPQPQWRGLHPHVRRPLACGGSLYQSAGGKGYKIAVCDQVEDPRTAKGLVKRAVTRVVTAGTTLEDANLVAKSHNYLGAVFWNEERGAGGFAWMDVSTGAWSGLQSSREPELWQWVFKLAPRELLLAEQAKAPAHLGLQTGVQVVRVPWQSHLN